MKFFFAIILFSSINLCAQQGEFGVEFQCTMNGEKLELGKKYYSAPQDDSISLDVLRFYISDLQLIENETVVKIISKKYILLDLEKSETLQIDTENFAGNFDKIKFKLGIDSLTNISGAMSEDLDPMYGMYWTWQSGYINLKMEGKADKCPARKGEFQFHLGGYQGENLAMQEVELVIKKQQKRSIINFPIDAFLEKINLQEDYKTMSPSTEAVKKSQLISTLFEINE